jgi:hypothetical protein
MLSRDKHDYIVILTSLSQLINKHIIVDMSCLKWISHHISGFSLWCDIALRKQSSQNKSTMVYIYNFPFENPQNNLQKTFFFYLISLKFIVMDTNNSV